MKTMKLKHFICLLPFFATACSDDDDTAMSIRTGQWTLTHETGYELYNGEKDEWNKTVTDREWIIFNEDGTYTLKLDELGNGTISIIETYRYTIEGDQFITYRKVDGDLKQTIRRHTDTELVLEEVSKEPDYEYKNTKTYRYEK